VGAVWDVTISRLVTEWLLPALTCPCCGEVTVAAAPAGAHPGSVSYGPGVNTAAVLLAAYGNDLASHCTSWVRSAVSGFRGGQVVLLELC
jgi:hypothetical protein